MEFVEATDALFDRVSHADLAERLDVSVASIRQARLRPEAAAHRAPPAEWLEAAIRLAEERVAHYRRLVHDLRVAQPRLQKMTDSPQPSIGKLIRDHVFQVPPYQRDYKWTVDKVSQLFDDVDAAMLRGDERYFLGLMVFMDGQGPTGLVVLDGQQRLASIFLYIAACRNWLRQHDDFRRDSEKLDTEFMGERRYGEEDISPRMVLNAANNQCFADFVVQSRPLADLQVALAGMKRHDRNRRLMESAVYCHDRVAKLAGDLGNVECAKHISNVVNFLNESSPVVSLTVPDEGTAFTIFETLNDRGMDLSPLDLVKNHLFRCVGDHHAAKQRDLESRWAQMMANLEEASPDQFIKVFWTSRHGRVQAHAVYRDFTKRYADQVSGVGVSVDMLAASERHAAMSNADDPVWTPYSEATRESVRSLHVLGAQQTRPVIMAALDRFDERNIERLLWLMEVLIVRYQFIGGGRTGPLEIECAKVAHGIFEKRIADTSAAFKWLRTIYPNDERFKASLRDMRKATATKTIYLLKGLEREADRQSTEKPVSGGHFDADLTVEHIWPQNGGPEWPNLDDDDADLPSLLGNLCLLRRTANRVVGRGGWTKKRRFYAESKLRLTSAIASEYDHWDRSTIIRRQNYLAELGVQAWRFQ